MNILHVTQAIDLHNKLKRLYLYTDRFKQAGKTRKLLAKSKKRKDRRCLKFVIYINKKRKAEESA